MSTGQRQRPVAGDGKNQVAPPCPECGRWVDHDTELDLMLLGRIPESFVSCSTRGCNWKLHYYQAGRTGRWNWELG